METVIEISSGEEDDLLIIKPKKVKLEKEENVNFTVKTIPGDGHVFWKELLRNSLFTMERISGKHSFIHAFQ